MEITSSYSSLRPTRPPSATPRVPARPRHPQIVAMASVVIGLPGAAVEVLERVWGGIIPTTTLTQIQITADRVLWPHRHENSICVPNRRPPASVPGDPDLVVRQRQEQHPAQPALARIETSVGATQTFHDPPRPGSTSDPSWEGKTRSRRSYEAS